MQNTELTRVRRLLLAYRLGDQEFSNHELSELLEKAAGMVLELADDVNRLSSNPAVQRAGAAPRPISTSDLAFLMSTLAQAMDRLEAQANARR